MMILFGTLLLCLPASSKSGHSVGFLNALFTATSANCVTGLVVINTMESWSAFGKIVILILIQLGALGLITVMALPMLMTQRRISLSDRKVIQSFFLLNEMGGMRKLLKTVVFITLLFESAGAVLLTILFYLNSTLTFFESFCEGVFHSISAFCCAGFEIFGTSGLIPFQTSIPINLVFISLMVAGSLGFPVWHEIRHALNNAQGRSWRLRIIHFSLDAKITFVVTSFLILAGVALTLLLEWSNPWSLGDLRVEQKFMAALFQSVSIRTAGFNTIATDGLTEATKFVSCLLMLIGGSSASTAGGIKVGTVGVIFFAILSVSKGRNKIEAFGRTMPLDMLQKALMVTCFMFFIVFVSSLILYFTEQSNQYHHTFLDLLFECSSATGTTGASTGITPHLSPAGKLVIIACMFLGRLSPVTLVMTLYAKLHESVDNLNLPPERIIIG